MSKTQVENISGVSSSASGEKHSVSQSVKSLREKKTFLREQLIAFQKQIFELQHEQQQSEERHRSEQAAVYQDVFEALDAFEQLEKTLEAKQEQMDKTALYLAKNVRSIHKKLLRMLKKRKIYPIDFSENKAEMKYCKVLETRASPDQEEETILSVLKTGYLDQRNDEVLRKAEVITVRNTQQA